MKLFKSYTYTWWQLGIFKLALIVFGLLIGAYWHDFFSGYLVYLAVLWIVPAVYIWYISLK